MKKSHFYASDIQKHKADIALVNENRILELNKKIADIEANDTSPFKKQKIRELRQRIKNLQK